MSRPILSPGRNCAAIARADRLAFISTGAAYFAHIADALERARQSVVFIGWDFDPRIRLRRGTGAREERFIEILERLAETKPGLTIRVLNWTYSMGFGAVRRQVPTPLLAPFVPPRLDIRLDTNHPVGGAHHQKIVVIDDALAFCGGIDMTAGRWDTPDHIDDDPRRVDDGLGSYTPYHDYAAAVTGPAARALGDVARERWRTATGEELARCPETLWERGRAPWPEGLQPHCTGVTVGVARTYPKRDGSPAVREVEALICDAIEAAQKTIYLETQYMSAHRPVEILCRRLGEPHGPEVVFISPPRANSPQEELTLGAAREHMVATLRRNDIHGRLAVYHPVTAHGRRIIAHGKLLIADDRLLSVGSANLANRSFGLDSECNLAVDAAGQDPAVAAAILDIRNQCLADHMGVTSTVLRDEVQRRGSLIAAIEALRRTPGKRLEPMPFKEPSLVAQLATDYKLFDPVRPRGPGAFLRSLGLVAGGLVRERPMLFAVGAALGVTAGVSAARTAARRRRADSG